MSATNPTARKDSARPADRLLLRAHVRTVHAARLWPPAALLVGFHGYLYLSGRLALLEAPLQLALGGSLCALVVGVVAFGIVRWSAWRPAGESTRRGPLFALGIAGLAGGLAGDIFTASMLITGSFLVSALVGSIVFLLVIEPWR